MNLYESPPALEETESIVEMPRLGGLSDAVYAVALTLLVLDIRLPEDILAGDVPAELMKLAPKLMVYLIGFVIVGGAWGSHQRVVSQIKRGDGLLVWFNLFSLLFVTLLPAASALLGRFPGTFSAILCFAADVILIQLTTWLLWRHASRNRLVNPQLDPRVVMGISRRLGLSGLAFTLSIPVALISIRLVYAIWLGLFILLFTTDWLSWQQVLRTEEASIPLAGAKFANLKFKHSGGHLLIAPHTDPEVLIGGVFGGGVDVKLERVDAAASALISHPKQAGFMSLRFPWAWSKVNSLDWAVELNRAIPISLSVEFGGGQGDLNLRDLNIAELNLKTSASSMNVTLPAGVTQTRSSFEASVVSLIIRVPEGLAARIRSEKALSTAEIDLNRFLMVRDGHEYRTADYENSAHCADIWINLSIGSVKIL
jgi:uncharacterized membrane protein